MASAALIQSNPVKRKLGIRLLPPPPPPPPPANCSSRIQFPRRIRPRPLSVKCIKNQPTSTSIIVGADQPLLPENNPRPGVIPDFRSRQPISQIPGSIILCLCLVVFIMYQGSMPFAASLVCGVLLHLMGLAMGVYLSMELARIVRYFPWTMIYENAASVVKLQVGLLGIGSSLVQNKLIGIAQAVDASAVNALNYVSTEVSVALLRNIDYCTAGYSSVDVKLSVAAWKEQFELFSYEEQGKLNFKNIWTPISSDQSDSESSNEDIVVTILLVVKGLQKLPSIKKTKDLKEALQKVGSILPENTLAVEVFWAPQNVNDMLWEQEF